VKMRTDMSENRIGSKGNRKLWKYELIRIRIRWDRVRSKENRKF
jgi:hypothetical protein